MIRKVLIANRGEIACRVIRAAKKLGIATVAVYSEPDAGLPHVRLADEAVPIGPGPAKHSYLDGDRIVATAIDRGCDAVHPGYGFLAENAEFAGACESSGLIFIGPRAETIGLMGGKTKARALMAEAGVPVLPGSGDLREADEAVRAAEEIGYPVMLKAVGGGGGIGHKVIRSSDEMRKEFPGVSQRAGLIFKNDRLFVERFLERPRHVEVQVLGDNDGNLVHLFERECTIQRRHQKVIEETGSPCLDEETRARLLACAVAGARRAGYVNAGTLEFLYEPERRAFYFMEVNARIQVEHPVTEMVTGIDIVEAQLRIAGGEPLGFTQADVRRSGHAVEARICAEDPSRGFAPQPGKLTTVEWPEGEGVRCDAGFGPGDAVPPFYDSLLGKVVAHGATRLAAIERLGAALERTRIEGVRTNMGLLRRIMADDAFRAGSFDTSYLSQRKDLLS